MLDILIFSFLARGDLPISLPLLSYYFLGLCVTALYS